jgi:PAS domain S-box-containing protein
VSERQRHGEERFRTVATAVADGVLVLDAEGRILFANHETEELFGYSAAELVGGSADRLITQEDLATHREALGRVRAHASSSTLDRVELSGAHRDGRRVPLEITYGTYEKNGDRFFTAIVRDLSERRRTESRLRFQARLLDAVGEAVIATDPEGRILYWNAAAERLYGWRSEEVVGRTIEETTPTAMNQARAAAIMERLRQGETWSGEFQVRDRSGREFPVLVTNSPVHDDDGSLMGIIGASKEITDRKRAEESQRFLAEAGRVLASSLDHETTLNRISKLAVPMLGEWCVVHLLQDRAEPSPVAHCTPDGMEDRGDELEAVLTEPGGVLSRVLPATQPVTVAVDAAEVTDGRGRRLADLGIVELLIVPLETRGQPLGAMTFARSAGARRYDDEDLRLAAELALRASSAIDNARLYRDAEESDRAKTDFLAVVSHELRTPLNAITGYAELLTAGISGQLNEQQSNQVERITVSARHLAQLIDEILTFARMEGGRDSLEVEPTDAGQLVRDAVSVLEPAARAKGLDLDVDGPERGPELLTDPGKLRQIVVNLVSNAVKYTETGSVRVMLRESHEGIEIVVADTGIGIPADQHDRIFEPFRQVQSPNTRTVGGTGLGLSVSRQLVRLMGGTIDVESASGVGSTFTVRLPHTPPER